MPSVIHDQISMKPAGGDPLPNLTNAVVQMIGSAGRLVLEAL